MADNGQHPGLAIGQRLVVVGADVALMQERTQALVHGLVRARCRVLYLASDASPQWQADIGASGAAFERITLEHRSFRPLAAYKMRRDVAARLTVQAPQALLAIGSRGLGLVLPAAADAGVPRIAVWLDGAADLSSRATLQALVHATDLIVPTATVLRHARHLLGEAITLHALPSSAMSVTAIKSLPLPKQAPDLVFAALAAPHDENARVTFRAAVARFTKMQRPARFIEAAHADDLARAHVVVQMSAGSGMDALVVESLAVGRPLIVAVAEGEAVDERINGWKVAPGDPVALADAFESAFACVEILPALARASRAKADRNYDLVARTRHLQALLGL